MAWSEFWQGIFPKYLQYCILGVLAMIKVVILLLLSAGCWLGLEYLFDKHSQAKKKSREKNEPVKISDKLGEEE